MLDLFKPAAIASTQSRQVKNDLSRPLPRNPLAQALLDEAKRRTPRNQAGRPVEVLPRPMRYGETNMKGFLEVSTARSITSAIEPTCYRT